MNIFFSPLPLLLLLLLYYIRFVRISHQTSGNEILPDRGLDFPEQEGKPVHHDRAYE